MRHDVSCSANVWLTRIVIGVCALACNVRVAAQPKIRSDHQISKQETTSAAAAPIRRAGEDNVEEWPLSIANLRIEIAPPGEKKPSALLKFHALNSGSSKLTDIVFEISIVEQPDREELDARRRLLAGPFTIRGNVVLEPGYTADYEMLLRNLSRDCRCAAKVKVVSVRFLPGSELKSCRSQMAPRRRKRELRALRLEHHGRRGDTKTLQRCGSDSGLFCRDLRFTREPARGLRAVGCEMN